MSDESAYNDLAAQKYNAEQRARNTENRISVLRGKIERLQEAKKILDQEENFFADIKHGIKGIVKKDYDWKGQNYDSFLENGDILYKSCRAYHNELDDVRDRINREIAGLENEIYEQNGILGYLHSLINSLCHQIENLFN